MIKIVVLQRGWVVVGRWSQEGHTCHVDGGFVVRRWGTSTGLGELAMKGPLPSTVLDESPRVSYHMLTAVLTVDCEADKWSRVCR